jgi:hypothetical protein
MIAGRSAFIEEGRRPDMKLGNVCIAMAVLLAVTVGVAPAVAQNYEILSKSRNPDEIVSVLTERLHLSEDQQERVRSIVTEDFEKREALRKKYKTDDSTDELSLLIELRRLTRDTEGRIEEILTEEQMGAYRGLKGEYLAKAQKEARAKVTDETILMMKERLQLTEEQADLVLPIIDQAMKERRALMERMRGQRGGAGGMERGDPSAMQQMRKEFQRIDERTEAQLSKILTQKQMEEYRQIKKEQRDRMRRRMPSRMGGRGDRREGSIQ